MANSACKAGPALKNHDNDDGMRLSKRNTGSGPLGHPAMKLAFQQRDTGYVCRPRRRSNLGHRHHEEMLESWAAKLATLTAWVASAQRLHQRALLRHGERTQTARVGDLGNLESRQ